MTLTAIATADEYLTAQAVAERLGMAERTIRRWVKTGKLPAQRVGRSFAIRLADAEELAGLTARRRVAAEAQGRERDHAYATLEGRYEELLSLVARLEAELAEERRRAAKLEVLLESAA